jgi:hypothetical protein
LVLAFIDASAVYRTTCTRISHSTVAAMQFPDYQATG